MPYFAEQTRKGDCHFNAPISERSTSTLHITAAEIKESGSTGFLRCPTLLVVHVKVVTARVEDVSAEEKNDTDSIVPARTEVIPSEEMRKKSVLNEFLSIIKLFQDPLEICEIKRNPGRKQIAAGTAAAQNWNLKDD